MSSTLNKLRAKYFCHLMTCTRPSKSMRLTLLAIRDWKAELELLLIPYSRALATSQSSTKLQLLQLQSTNRKTMPPMRPTSSSLAMRVLWRLPLTLKMKLGYLSLTLWKIWWVETMFSKLRWLGLFMPTSRALDAVSGAIPLIT